MGEGYRRDSRKPKQGYIRR